jgi:DNA-binding LacI/PurR family transcriptional regulator
MNMKDKPLYRQIFDVLYAGISEGRYVDGRLPTDGQLVRRFKTTRTTVAKAMHELEAAGLITRHPGAGSFVRPTSRAHGAFVSTLIAGLGDTEFFEPICAQIAQSCHACNLSLLWGPESHSTAISRDMPLNHVVDHFVRQQVRGVFFAPDEGANERNWQVAELLTKAGIAVILLDRDIVPFPKQSSYDLVGIDNVNAGYQQAQHLIECGCKRLLYVTRPDQLWTKAARIQGFRMAVENAGLSFSGRQVCIGDTTSLAFCKTLLKQKPDGIVCFHDPIAAHLLQHFQKLKIDVPGKIKIIGLDDVSYSQFLPIPITTLRQPCRSIGTHAAELMALRINNDTHPPRRILFETQLIVRQSSLLSS